MQMRAGALMYREDWMDLEHTLQSFFERHIRLERRSAVQWHGLHDGPLDEMVVESVRRAFHVAGVGRFLQTFAGSDGERTYYFLPSSSLPLARLTTRGAGDVAYLDVSLSPCAGPDVAAALGPPSEAHKWNRLMVLDRLRRLSRPIIPTDLVEAAGHGSRLRLFATEEAKGRYTLAVFTALPMAWFIGGMLHTPSSTLLRLLTKPQTGFALAVGAGIALAAGRLFQGRSPTNGHLILNTAMFGVGMLVASALYPVSELVPILSIACGCVGLLVIRQLMANASAGPLPTRRAITRALGDEHPTRHPGIEAIRHETWIGFEGLVVEPTAGSLDRLRHGVVPLGFVRAAAVTAGLDPQVGPVLGVVEGDGYWDVVCLPGYDTPALSFRIGLIGTSLHVAAVSVATHECLSRVPLVPQKISNAVDSRGVAACARAVATLAYGVAWWRIGKQDAGVGLPSPLIFGWSTMGMCLDPGSGLVVPALGRLEDDILDLAGACGVLRHATGSPVLAVLGDGTVPAVIEHAARARGWTSVGVPPGAAIEGVGPISIALVLTEPAGSALLDGESGVARQIEWLWWHDVRVLPVGPVPSFDVAPPGVGRALRTAACDGTQESLHAIIDAHVARERLCSDLDVQQIVRRLEARRRAGAGAVFISYRRGDTGAEARQLHERLLAAGVPVFMDTTHMPQGAHFPTALRDAVCEAHCLVVLIGPDWFRGGRERTERPRIAEREDWVAREIEFATSVGVAVLPVLVRGAELPPLSALPRRVRRLWMPDCAASPVQYEDDKVVDRIRSLKRPRAGSLDLPGGAPPWHVDARLTLGRDTRADVPARLEGSTLFVDVCPYCGLDHTHTVDGLVEHEGWTTRGSHCSAGSGPGDYRLVLVR